MNEKFFRKLLEDNTKEKFEEEEIKEYIIMALEEYLGWIMDFKPLTHDKMRRWLRYKILQYGNQALSVPWIVDKKKNTAALHRLRKSSERKARIYRSKSAGFFK